jgi:divalent metal cation (Fe/Co/Zn/Cd) transporter
VAIFRIRVGKQINSAALVADGYHARVDGRLDQFSSPW